MKYYAVIDTNVIISAMLKHNSVPGIIFELVINDTIVPLLNEEIIAEYYEVHTRKKFGFAAWEVEDFLNEIKTKSIYLTKEPVKESFIDEDDKVFYEIVMSARKTMDAYLITGNIKHFPKKQYVVTPKEMIDILSKK